MSSKGKAVATGGKRKRCGGADDDNSGGGRKRKNREVLKFFEDAADVDEDESDSSDFDDDEYDIELKIKKEPVKTQNLPFIPKEEVIDEEEFDKMLEERYRAGSSFVSYPEDAYDDKSVERNYVFPSIKDPTIWKVKCMVGRERHSAFCLMQKFVDLKSLGTQLQIISAFAIDHIKGFVFIEADKECDINEACKGLCSIYASRIAPVPKNEVSHLLSVRSKSKVISEGMWARVKSGKYKGDLAQIVSVNDARKRATVKLIPRIDLQAMAQKFGGGISMRNVATPAPRLISSSELEEFRPLVQIRRDRDTGEMFEVLDGLMLKDGYLYKKVSVDSLSCCGVMPSEEELLKFQPSENNESDNSEWLKQLYGSPKKKRIIRNDKVGVKGESSSGSGMQNGFELYDLVCFGRKDFGLIVGMEKDYCYKILKDGPEAPIVMTVAQHEIKNGPTDMKFTAFDHCKKAISVGDTVKVLEGPLKDRQGIVKQIYRGILFMYDRNETENGGYICSKAHMCDKIKLSFDVGDGKGGQLGLFGFEDIPSSPKSPLSPKKPWQTKEINQDFNRRDKDGIFSIGQTLRIRVGPLKGYLCRVLAIHYSDVTVKLDSQQKVLTVKCEHLSEVRGKSFVMPASEDPGSSSFKPFNLLGTEGGSTGWTDGAGTSADSDRWNAGGVTTESTSWPSFSSSGFKLQPDSNGTKEDASWERKETSNQNSSWGAASTIEKPVANNDQAHDWGRSEDCWNRAATNVGSSSGGSVGWGKVKPDAGNSATGGVEAWDKGKSVTENPTSSWGGVATGKNQLDSWGSSKDVVESGSWGKSKSSSADEEQWNKGTGWNQEKSQKREDTCGSTAEAQNNDTAQVNSWGKTIEKWDKKDSSVGDNVGWKSSTSEAKKPTESWGNAGSCWAQPETENTETANHWTDAKVDGTSQAAIRGNWKNCSGNATGWTTGGSGAQNLTGSWNKPKTVDVDGGSWNKKEECSWSKQDVGSKEEVLSWGKKEGGSAGIIQDGGSAWSKQDGGSWNKTEECSWSKQKGGSAWSKQDGESKEEVSPWSKKEGGSAWNKQDGGSAWTKQDGGSRNKKEECSWSKQEGGSAWSKQDGGSKKEECSWDKKEGGSAWSKQDGGQEFDGWNKAFDGGRGSCGRRGRGGGRAGGNQFGSNRSFGEGQSLGWKRGGEGNNQIGGETSSRNLPSWSDDQVGVWGKSKGSKEIREGWKKPNSSWGDNGAGWNKNQGADKESGSSGDKWNSAKPSRENEGPSESWDAGSKGNMGKDSVGDIFTGWRSGTHGEGAKQSNWGAPKSSNMSGYDAKLGDADDIQASGWGNKSSWSSPKSNWNEKSDEIGKENNQKDQGDGWNGGKALDGESAKGCDQSASWKSGSNDTGAGKSDYSNWGKKSIWNSGSGDSCGNTGSSWGKKSNWNSGPNDANQNQDSGWAKKSNLSSESGEANQSSGWGSTKKWTPVSDDADRYQDSGWGKKGNWNSESSDANQCSGWSKKSNWNSGSTDANQGPSSWGRKSSWNRDSFEASGEGQTENSGDRPGGGNWRGGGRGGSDRGFRGRGERGHFGGRNCFDRGGYGGRGRSDRGGFGGRGNSDGGGYGGKGRSDRGGFSGRGRRDYYGGWTDKNDSGEDKALDWKSGANNGANNNGGWSSGGGSWNQGGADRGHGRTLNTGNGESSNQTNGWSSQGSGWNQSAKAKDGYSGDLAGGWNKGIGADGEAARIQANDWKLSNSSGGSQRSSWIQSSQEAKVSNDGGGGWDSQGGWSKGNGSGDADVRGDQAKSWNIPSDGPSWNQLKDEGTSADEEPNSWGKTSGSTWDSKVDNGSSRGW